MGIAGERDNDKTSNEPPERQNIGKQATFVLPALSKTDRIWKRGQKVDFPLLNPPNGRHVDQANQTKPPIKRSRPMHIP